MASRQARAGIVLFAAGALLASACSADGSETDSGSTDSGSTASSTTTELATADAATPETQGSSTTQAPTATESTTADVSAGETADETADESTTETSGASAVCPSGDLPSGPSSAPVNTDVDGDGNIDVAYAVQTSTAWNVVVEFGAGGSATLPLAGANLLDTSRVVGGADLAGDGTQELIVTLGSGAYLESLGLVRARGCELVQLAFEDSSPAVFLSGASVSGGEALVCLGDGNLERYFFSLIDDGGEQASAEYEGGFSPYKIEGDVVVAYPGDGATLTDDDIRSFNLFDCLGLVL